MRSSAHITMRTAVRQLLPQSPSKALPFPATHRTSNHKSRSTPKKSNTDIIKIKQENYRLNQQCHSQIKSIKLLEQRVSELKSENDKLKTEKDLQDEILKKLKAKFLYVPASEVLSKQCIELKKKVDLYKNKYNKIRKQYLKIQKQNISFKHQLNNTNTALHNILSKKYVILNSNKTPQKSVSSTKSNVCYLIFLFHFGSVL